LAKEIIKRTKEFEIECWIPEVAIDKVLEWRKEGIIYRMFPSFSLSPRYGTRELSTPMLHKLRRILKQEKALIHLHGVFNWSSYLIAALYGGRVPTIAQHHGDLPSEIELLHELRKRNFKSVAGLFLLSLSEFVPRQMLSKIDYFFALNSEVKDYLVGMVGEDKVTLQTMGIDFHKFRPMSKEKVRKNLGLKTKETYILYVGAFTKSKGLDYLIYSLPEILEDYPNVVLLLIGDGYYRKRLESLCRKLEIKDKVRFLGYVEYDKLPYFYNAADVCVLPSLREGLGLVAVEAMACETPLIGTKVGGIPEAIKNFEAGMLIPPADSDAIAEAISKNLLNRSKFRVNRSRAKKCYSWTHIITNTLRIYESLIQEYFNLK